MLEELDGLAHHLARALVGIGGAVPLGVQQDVDKAFATEIAEATARPSVLLCVLCGDYWPFTRCLHG
jgi:hypothetical protein